MNRIAEITPRKGTHSLSRDLDEGPSVPEYSNAYEGLPETLLLDEKNSIIRKAWKIHRKGRYLGMQAGCRT